MAKIILTWELGSALGHISRLRELAGPLSAKGYKLYLASRYLNHVEDVFGDIPVTVLQAPQYSGRNEPRIRRPEAFCHILYNNGYLKVSTLKSLVAAWRNLIELVSPDVVIADHSPTALLSCRGLDVKTVNIGNGFSCPPQQSPLGVFEPEKFRDDDHSQILRDEELVLNNVNQVLQGCDLPKLQGLADIYNTDKTFLTTLSELDHFGEREGERYYGFLPTDSAYKPDWPDKPGKKIFAYLKPFAKLPYLLGILQKSGLPTLIYTNNIPEDFAKRFSSDSIRFVQSPVDLGYAASQCDLAIVHANHGTCTQLLINGIPLLMLPLHREQVMFARKVVNSGAGVIAPISDIGQVKLSLVELVENPGYRQNAESFSSRYANFDFKTLFDEIIFSIGNLTTG